MKKLNGIWWTIEQKQVPGELIITDENKITLMTNERLYETNIINGFAEGEEITLINAILDLTKAYRKPEKREEINGMTIEINHEVMYYTYTYTADIAIFGYNYKRKGDIRLKVLQLNYTNLEEWVEWKAEKPKIEKTKENIEIKLKNFPEKRAKLELFNLSILKPYFFTQKEYNMQIYNETVILIDNIYNTYIEIIQQFITYIQFFLILCMGDNINVTQIKGIDTHDNKIEMILRIAKSNYENRSIFKNIIKYHDIEENLEEVLNNWLKLSINDELLIANFVNLQRKEETLISEFKNIASAIDSLYLVIIKKNKTNDHFAEIVKKLVRETNFILNLSEEQIQDVAIKAKDIRRYFVHSNKTQKEMVSNISYVTNLMAFLIEVIRARIMIEIGIDQKVLEEYYKKKDLVNDLKNTIINNINEEDLEDERIKEGKKLMRPLTKREKEEIANLNAIMGTKYREGGYDLENSEDLIEAIINVTAEYMDYTNYWGKLEDVIEDFDQTLKVFYPEKWFKDAKEGTTGNELMDATANSLNEACDNMFKLSMEAEKRCREVWNFLLTGNNEKAKQHFLGDISKYTEEELVEALEDTIEHIGEVEYKCQIQDDTQSFANEIKWSLENR